MKTISRYIMTLALLLTAVTGAWAADEVLLTTITATGHTSYSQSPDGIVTVTLNNINSYHYTYGWLGGGSVTVEAPQGYTITRCVFKQNPNSFPNRVLVDDQAPFTATIVPNLDGGNYVSAATSTGDAIGDDFMNGISYIEVYGYLAEPPIEVTPVAGKTNEWTFSMPGSDVVLTPQYAPAAKWDVVENVEQLPAALEGIIAGQDAAIVTAGQSAQGTVMYAVTTSAEAAPALTAFSATVPTAKDVADDGATLYVWYYIKGADTPDGQQATEENTFNDTEICTTPLTVQVLTNKFDITLNAANANTIEAGKATVTVGGTAATVTDGKLQGVKMGSEVKIKAATGYKFRKVEVKKKAAPAAAEGHALSASVVGEIVGTDGKAYAVADKDNLPEGVTVAAKVCYVDGTGHGLALALTDEVEEMNWSTAQTTCAAHTPAITGGTWKLASKDEWNNMITAAGSHTALRDGFSSVGGTNMQSDFYWSSTTISYGAWYYTFDGGSWSNGGKGATQYVRACLAF